MARKDQNGLKMAESFESHPKDNVYLIPPSNSDKSCQLAWSSALLDEILNIRIQNVIPTSLVKRPLG